MKPISQILIYQSDDLNITIHLHSGYKQANSFVKYFSQLMETTAFTELGIIFLKNLCIHMVDDILALILVILLYIFGVKCVLEIK